MSEGNLLHLSNVYKYIQQFGIKGHTIGRKVGDLVELLTYAYLRSKDDFEGRIRNEERIEGFSGAQHKVEFVIVCNGEKVGLIECKRVGVEVTTLQSLKTQTLAQGQSIDFSFNPSELRSLGWTASFTVEVDDVHEDRIRLNIGKSTIHREEVEGASGMVRESHETETTQFDMLQEQEILFVATRSGYEIIGPNRNLSDIEEDIVKCRFAHLARIRNNNAVIQFKEALPGPQTIEKAKQIGFVALDVRRRIQGKWGKEEIIDEERDRFTSLLVLAEISHWEEKSRKCVLTTLDHVIYIPDNIIVETLELLVEEFGEENFRDRIRVKLFDEDEELRRTLGTIIAKHSDNMFRNIEDDNTVSIEFENCHLKIEFIGE